MKMPSGRLKIINRKSIVAALAEIAQDGKPEDQTKLRKIICPPQVNVTIDLGQLYHVAYVLIKVTHSIDDRALWPRAEVLENIKNMSFKISPNKLVNSIQNPFQKR